MIDEWREKLDLKKSCIENFDKKPTERDPVVLEMFYLEKYTLEQNIETLKMWLINDNFEY